MARTLKSTPQRDGFWMPAEFEPHAGCWMLWPERPDNWRRNALPAQRAYVAVATTIARFEPVSVGASAAQYERARTLLPAAVRVVEISSNDAWMRDVGPSFVVNSAGERRGVDWQFNAWGGLYRPWDADNVVAQKVLEIEGGARYCAALVNEGGAIHVDGQGTALVTEQCLLAGNRNPRLTRREIETRVQRYLNVQHIIWLGAGVVDDETGGHIDNLACFAAPGELCLTWTDDRRDPQHAVSRDALERLLAARDARGRRLTIHKLPMPGPLHMSLREAQGIQRRRGIRALRAGQRLAGSYVNFYLANGAVIAPLLDPRTDAAALRQLRRIFPGRRVVGIASREILLGGGNIHCITQQVPTARRVHARR